MLGSGLPDHDVSGCLGADRVLNVNTEQVSYSAKGALTTSRSRRAVKFCFLPVTKATIVLFFVAGNLD